MSRWVKLFCSLVSVTFCFAQLQAQVIYSNTTAQDAFLATGSPDNPEGTDLTNLNFGAAGTLAISPANADKGQFQSILMFNFSGAVPFFNSSYGSNGWVIAGISLQLAGNNGTNGAQPNNKMFNVVNNGNFAIEWLSDNDWAEGTGTPNLATMDGVTFGSLPMLLSYPCEILCTNTYSPPGNNVPETYTLPLNTNLIGEIEGGTNATLLLYAADNQIGYIFNSHEYGRGDQPMIFVAARPFLEILSGSFTNDVFYLTGQGGGGLQYQVQDNTDLANTNWQTLSTATADASGLIQFEDVAATNQQRFYRLLR